MQLQSDHIHVLAITFMCGGNIHVLDILLFTPWQGNKG
jgi:hypothetical protein